MSATAAGARPDSSGRTASYRRYLEIALVVVWTMAIGAPSLLYPFGRDQGEYACIASAALRGKIVYSQVFNVKPPLTHIVHEAALVAFGHTMQAIRLLDLLWQAATAVLVLLIARRVFRQRLLALGAGALYGILYFLNSYWDTAQTDGFLTLFLALGVLLWLVGEEHDSLPAYLASGAAVAVACLFKYSIGLLLPALMLLALTRPKPSWRGAVAIAVGFALPLGVCAASLAREGALRDFLRIQTAYLPDYTLGGGLSLSYLGSVLKTLLLLRWDNITIWLSALALPVWLCTAREPGLRRRMWPVLAWWAAAIASLGLQNKGAPYHAMPFLGPHAIIVARLAAVAAAAAKQKGRFRLALAGLAEVLVLAPVIVFLGLGYPFSPGELVGVATGRITVESLWDRDAFGYKDLGDTYFQADLDVARYLEAHTQPGETVFVWGFEPMIYFLARRDCASRFIYNYPLYGKFHWPEMRPLFLQEIEQARPRYIVVTREDALPWVTGTDEDSRAALDGFPAFKSLLASEYRLEATIEHFSIYRRAE